MLNASDSAPLKKLLEYDPYLDPNLIPRMPEEWGKEEYLKQHPDIAAKAEETKKKVDESLRMLREDKDANIIFARQDCKLYDGLYFGMERDKCYLYISAGEDFLNGADAKLKKSVASISRAGAELEKKIIDTIEKEQEKTDAGLGSIFG